jgi:deoxyribodipyrimidine photo-lyase
MATPLDTPDIEHLIQAKLPGNLQAHLVQHSTNIKGFQQGGVTMAHETLDSFLKFRSRGYTRDISNPAASRESCSRLSPYLAWGNISMREVYQFAKSNGAPRPFMSRLRWHCHFIQKFESETRYESENINRGYDSIRNEINEDFLDAWEKGLTGFPLVDACMRAVKATGYLNFRMRAMLVSFLTHHLWQDWRTGVKFLGRQFLDFEPGIHYTQFQMQAGVTGINTIRIYNPVKQAMDHDREAAFISEWVPELAELPVQFRLEPWKMTNIEQQMYKVIVGKDYPNRIIDHQKTYRRASAELYRMKGNEMVKSEARRILAVHTIPNRRV